MKRYLFIFAMLVGMTSPHVYSQTAAGTGKAGGNQNGISMNLEPPVSSVEILNHPYYYSKTSDAVKPLEKSVAGTKTKYKLLGYGGVDFQYQIQGEKSGLKIAGTDSVSFLINTAGAAVPELVLYRVRGEKGKRQATSASYKTFGGMQSGDNVIAFNVLSLSNGLYRIVPVQKLDSGEYFFAGKPATGSATIDVYAFGID